MEILGMHKYILSHYDARGLFEAQLERMAAEMFIPTDELISDILTWYLMSTRNEDTEAARHQRFNKDYYRKRHIRRLDFYEKYSPKGRLRRVQ
jgi:hypothetical protein